MTDERREDDSRAAHTSDRVASTTSLPSLPSLPSPTTDSLMRDVAKSLEPNVAPLLPGQVLGRYVLRRWIGEGGMGTVYEADDQALGRRTALKVVRAAIASSPEARVRLQREARCAAAVSHPGVAQVFDVGESDGRVYIAMELIEGRSLRHVLSGGPMSRARALHIMQGIVSAVAAAHDAGVVHRDLKPENILVCADDAIKVLDFGLATWVEASLPKDEAVSPTLSQLTPGRMNGTPGYLAPEQARGQRVTARADLFSLGVILYELLFGERPFRGETVMDTIVATTRDEPRIDLRDPLAPVIRRCLAKNADARFASAGELEAALRAPAAIVEPRRRRPGAPFVMVALVCALGGGTFALQRAVGASRAIRREGAERPAVELAAMVHFPRATFAMGTTAADIEVECRALGAKCRRDLLDREQPPRNATVGPLYFDIHEVTNADFVSWLRVSQNAVADDPELKGKRWVKDLSGTVVADLWPGKVGYRILGDRSFEVVPGEELKPATQVTWDGAREYCQSRGKRLPTEAEWEYVARGSGNRRYPWGDASPTCDGVVYGRESGACVGRPMAAAAVMTSSQDRTPEGIFDLGGNVSEWVEDAFVLPYYPSCGTCDHPVIARPSDDTADLRLFRGSSWSNTAHLRTSRRGRWKRTEGPDDMGFRCAADG